MAGLEDLMARRQRVLHHLMTSLEKWRGSQRVSMLDDTHLTEEEKELKHAYDLLQKLISEVQQTTPPGQLVNILS